jgi:hypothetical protein
VSGRVVSYLLDPPAKAYGADLAVAVAIADRCGDDGRGCWAGDEDIARRANLCHFGELEKPSADSSAAEHEAYRRTRENAKRSTKRSIENNVASGLVVDEGPSRFGTRCRGIAMPDTMSVPDTMSADRTISGQEIRDADTVSVNPDTTSPKPLGEQSRELTPPLSPLPGEGAGSGLSPCSTTASPEPPAHLVAEAREDFERAEVGTPERLAAYQRLNALGLAEAAA